MGLSFCHDAPDREVVKICTLESLHIKIYYNILYTFGLILYQVVITLKDANRKQKPPPYLNRHGYPGGRLQNLPV